MALETSKYVVLTSAESKGRPDERRREILRRWFIKCPQCLETWLAPGVRENDWHICRGCGHGFIKPAAAAEKESIAGFSKSLS